MREIDAVVQQQQHITAEVAQAIVVKEAPSLNPNDAPINSETQAEIFKILNEMKKEIEILKQQPHHSAINQMAIESRLKALEGRTDSDTVYNDEDIQNRLKELEGRADADTIYDDGDIKRRLTDIEDKLSNDTSETPDTGWIDITDLVKSNPSTSNWRSIGFWSIRRVGNRVLFEGRNIATTASSFNLNLNISGFNGLYQDVRVRPGDTHINSACSKNTITVIGLINNNSSVNYFRNNWDTLDEFPDSELLSSIGGG